MTLLQVFSEDFKTWLILRFLLKITSSVEQIWCFARFGPFLWFKKREKHPWRNFTFSKIAGIILSPMVRSLFWYSYSSQSIVFNECKLCKLGFNWLLVFWQLIISESYHGSPHVLSQVPVFCQASAVVLNYKLVHLPCWSIVTPDMYWTCTVPKFCLQVVKLLVHVTIPADYFYEGTAYTIIYNLMPFHVYC